MLTRAHLQALGIDADTWLWALNNALLKYEINTATRVAMFLAQCAHESGGFRHLVESLNYSAKRLRETWPNRFTEVEAADMAHDEERIGERAYGGRMGNGPEGSGNGFKYRGRGIIQITGRETYGKAGAALGLDLLGSPELLTSPKDSCAAAGWYWSTHGCNQLADAQDFEGVTRRINGGLNGLADRKVWLAKAYSAMGTQPGAPIEERSPPALRQRKEEPMGGTLIAGLISALIQGFSPQAEKLVSGVLDKAGATSGTGQALITNIANAVLPGVLEAKPQEQVAAFAAAAKDPAVMAKVEATAVEYINAVSPFMDKLAKYEGEARRDTIEDTNNSVLRKNPALLSQRALAWMIFGAMVLVGLAMILSMAMMWYQVFKAGDGKVDAFVASLATMAFMAITSMAQAPFRSIFGNMFESQTAATGRETIAESNKQRGRQ